jgi:pimeloyl-ACP methyl ester carboxylesterase
MMPADAIERRIGAPDLMVWLPGALMTPRHMEEAGLFEAVRERGLALDLLALNLHALEACNRDALRMLADRLAVERRHYTRVWLGGISRGGHLALSFLAEHPEGLNGLCLLAPYPGSRLTTNAIQRAGGLQAWQATREQLQDPEFRLWQWLQQPRVDVPLLAGWGEQDRFVDGMRALSDCLPTADIHTVPGEHDWKAWLPLWERFLAAGHFGVKP